MGSMTMVFQVADPRLLEGLKPGDRIRFRAERVGGQFTVVAVEPAP
jgi:Cu/Ag efflux protein CusF